MKFLSYKPNQNGGVTLLMIFFLIMVISMGLIGLSVSDSYFRKNERLNVIWFHQINLVESALAWGTQQQWPEASDAWQCKRYQNEINSCLKRSHYQELVILKAEISQVKRYRLMTQLASGELILKQQGWLDYCPDYHQNSCE